MFDNIPPSFLLIGSTIAAIGMGTMAMIVRSKAAKRPINERRIILPPFFMSTGALMFVFEEFRLAPPQIIEAIIAGLIFSIVLIATTKFEVKNQEVYLKQSKAFLIILIILLAIRVVAKIVLSSTFDIGELGGMFWLLAFSMLLPWRIAMLIKYKKMMKNEIFVV